MGVSISLLPTMEIKLDIDHISVLLKLNGNEEEPLTLSLFLPGFSAIQFSSVAQSCLTLCDPMNRSMPGLPVHHQLPEFTQTLVH